MPYVRTVMTKSGATAVQIVCSSQRGSRRIEHLGSAYDDAGLKTLKAAARQRIAAGQAELDLGLDPAAGGPLPITSSRMGCLLDALGRAYQVLWLEAAADGDEVFRHLVLARIIEPVSMLDSIRVLEEACGPGRTGSRSWSAPLKGTRPRPRRCCRSSRRSGQSRSSLSADEFPAPRMSSSPMTGGHDGQG